METVASFLMCSQVSGVCLDSRAGPAAGMGWSSGRLSEVGVWTAAIGLVLCGPQVWARVVQTGMWA